MLHDVDKSSAWLYLQTSLYKNIYVNHVIEWNSEGYICMTLQKQAQAAHEFSGTAGVMRWDDHNVPTENPVI